MLLFSSSKSVFFTLHHVATDDRCITNFTPSHWGLTMYHIHPGGFFDPPTHQDRINIDNGHGPYKNRV